MRRLLKKDMLEKERPSWSNFARNLVTPFFLCSLLVFIFYHTLNPSLLSIYQHAIHQIVEENCNLSVGRWIEDLSGSLYTNLSCSTIPDSKNCFMNGRMDRDFLNWRWKPDGCELPRFDSKSFLQIARGKKMAFIGDSVARNQFESLLCLLSKEEIPVDIEKDSEDRFRTWHFRYYDFTLMILWTKFLVIGEEKVINGSSNSGIYDLHFDKIDQEWAQKLPGLDYAIISDAHWFFRELHMYNGDTKFGCVYCNEPNVTNYGPGFAIKMSFRAALNYINKCNDCERMRTVVRTFSPAHFENGSWNTGGNCNRVAPRKELEIEMDGHNIELRNMQVEEIENANEVEKDGKKLKRFEVLDVTRAMTMRPDGHPGVFTGNKWMKGYSDCVHWCLPGPIDLWNDLLLAILIRNRKE